MVDLWHVRGSCEVKRKKLKTRLPAVDSDITRQEGRGSVFHSWELNFSFHFQSVPTNLKWQINNKNDSSSCVLTYAIPGCLKSVGQRLDNNLCQGQDVNREPFIPHVRIGRKECRVKTLISLHYIKLFYTR